MSLTLGEKLRQAREERGFTLSEVAEQTRISSLYLESIEHDDYRILPGGIFNKGFVKSYAKFVGVNEQEALLDYSNILSESAISEEAELKLYKPEVLTDDRSSASVIPTAIIAVVILALMTVAILFLVNYLREPSAPVVANNSPKTNTAAGTPANTDPGPPKAPEMATLKIEFKALSQPVSLTATSDGKTSSNVVTAGSTVTFEPKESLKLSYSKSLANFVQMAINGKAITLPAQPLVPRRNAIEFEINKDNLAQIWTSAIISSDVPAAAPDANANISPVATDTVIPPSTIPTQARPTPVPKPSITRNSATNAVTKPTPDRKPPETPNPPTMSGKPPSKKP
ncbi:MAG: helix-turn-helix domain-containing protein [Pyrinomonadaceae bacterium]